ncbi:hypothetical protein E1263_20245 [Kribbella antibiotica]|uniref:Uncharacterized protein n=1 Tax=Kribbella antibiotica TaxID=190195 RepID=A0A4R4ZHW4_9ACTN|nr:hypothetical protein E1263_20245 [Kribbella antibiotica]
MSHVESRNWLCRHLGAAEADRLGRTVVSVAPAQMLDLVTLLLGWYEHVTRIEKEFELPDSDRSVWGAHDLVAADFLRDFVARGLELVPEGEAKNFLIALSEVDSKFLSYTEEDKDRVVIGLSGDESEIRGWWWSRIPISGPVRRDLDQLSESL